MAVFSNIILQKRVLDAGKLFPSSHVWDDRPFRRKILQGQRPFFNKIGLLILYLTNKEA